MSQKQLNRYVVIEKSLEGIISVKDTLEINYTVNKLYLTITRACYKMHM